MRAYILLIFFTFTGLQNAFSQNVNDSLSATYKKNKPFLRSKTILPAPIIFRLPETGFAAGALVTTTFRFGKDSVSAKPSQLSLGGAYTERKQLAIYMPFSIFYDNDKYYVSGEIGWYKYSYKYFGIGENQVPEEIYGVNFPKIKLLATKQIAKNLYGGLRYQYENYQITATELSSELASGKISGSNKSVTSSLGIAFLKDSRDAVFYPRKGIFGEFYVLPTNKLFEADRNFLRIALDIADYQALSPKIVLATNAYFSYISGENIPFNQLSLLGGPKKMRGIYEGRFRDKNIALFQAELRAEIWGRLGAVAFSSLGFLGDEKDFLRLNQPKATYGVGLRFNAIRKEHINIRADYGIMAGEKGNFYLTIGEAF